MKTTDEMQSNGTNMVLPAVPTDTSWRRCNHCGKYISYEQLESQKDVMHVFIPDTEHTTEASYYVHRHCIKRQ